MENAANAWLITEEAEKSPDASFQKPVKKPMTGQLIIYIRILIKTAEFIDSPEQCKT
jgi:hypothetical protein